jgi:hypothetical protein
MRSALPAGSLIVAIVSLVIANRSLWLNWKHWKDERHILVKVLVGHDHEPRQKLSAMISAISLSEHSVEIVSAGFVTQDGARRQMTLGRAQGLELPRTISPRAKKVWLIEADEFVRAGFDGYTPIVGSVEDATGPAFSRSQRCSDPQTHW